MFTNKFYMKLLMVGALLALLFTAACSTAHAIKGPAEEALAEQGDAMMAVIKAGDLKAIYAVLNRENQQMVDKASSLASNVVNVERLVEQSAPKITTWEFDRARLYTKNGATRGRLEGRVEYVDGKAGKVRMELEHQDGVWKLSGWTFDQ